MAYANMRGNMPCWTKIYAIFGTIKIYAFLEPSVICGKNPKRIFIYFRALDFFPQNTLGDGPAFLIFKRLDFFDFAWSKL